MTRQQRIDDLLRQANWYRFIGSDLMADLMIFRVRELVTEKEKAVA